MKFLKRLSFLIISLIVLVGIVFLIFYYCNKRVKAQNEMKLFPTSYTLESEGDIIWENPINAFSQDLFQDASFSEFNEDNSAFIKRKESGITDFPQENPNNIQENPNNILEETTPLSTSDSATSPSPIQEPETPQQDSVAIIPSETSTTTLQESFSTTTPPTLFSDTPTFFSETSSTPLLEPTTNTTLLEETTNTTLLPEEAPTTTTEPFSLLKKIFSFLIHRVNAEEEISQIKISSNAFTSLIFENFSLPVDFGLTGIQNVQLRFSLAGKGFEGDKLIIKYFYNDEWQSLSEIDLSSEISNEINGGYFLYSLPVLKNYEEFKNLKIKFEYQGRTDSQLYLDSIWVEIYYESLPIKYKSDKRSWKINEDPEFHFPNRENNFLAQLESAIKSKSLKISLILPDGKETQEGIIVLKDKIQILRNNFKKFQPGLYKLKIVKGDEIIIQEFSWGVLTINTNKSIFLPYQIVSLQMAVLNNEGHTICDANLELKIKNQSSGREDILSTNNGAIKYSGVCGPNNITDIPDYFAYYRVEDIGIYQMTLTNLDNGYSIDDYFEVKEFVPFDIERIGPTRIYPLSQYQMKIKIKANEDFNGEIIESVPDSFIISPDSKFQIQNSKISWNINLVKGDGIELNYIFDAPDIFPYIYFLGPLKIGDFQESRQWQIASDAVARMILLWDPADGSIPSGWTCVSCSSGDDFYQRFIRGNSTYGGYGGQNQHTHPDPSPLTSGGASGSATGAAGKTGAAVTMPPLFAHTHTASIISGLTETNLPEYRQLKVIRYDNGIPSVLPQGVIAIFDATPPSGWTTTGYNDGKYIMGENSSGIGGANEHTHTIVLGQTSNATDSSAKAGSGATVGGISHYHPSGAQATTPSQNHEPPYMTVILAKKDSNGPIPSGMIAMFDATPPSTNWSVNSGSGQAFYQRFFKPTGSYGSYSDTSTHTHSNLTITTNGPSGTSNAATGSTYSSSSHTHNFTINFGSPVSHLPPYRDAIFAKASSSPQPNLTQIHYHWRNDDGSESSATSATSGSEDTPYDTFFYMDNKRLRIEISNAGTSAAENMQFRLEYGLKTNNSCGDITTWVDVGASGGDWDMYDSSYLTDGDSTTDISVASGGVSNENNTFKTPNYAVKDTSSQVASITLTYEDFIEMEFSIKPNVSSGTYCFRITNAGSTTNFNYTRYPETTVVANSPPTVSNVKLNNQTNIDLVENSTTTIYATADLYDAQGCNTIISVSAKIYRSGVPNGKDCTENENNCYSVSNCNISNCNGNYASTTCAVDLWFNADPTDSGTPWESEYWRAYIEATDSGSLTGSGYSPSGAPDINSLLALNVTNSINYGSLNPGEKNDPLDKITTVTATGNVSLDVNLYGTNLCTDYPTCAGFYIPVGKQHYATSSVSYSNGTALLSSPGADLDLNCPKTTDHSNPQTKNIYWGIEIPNPQKAGIYNGEITITGKKNELPWP